MRIFFRLSSVFIFVCLFLTCNDNIDVNQSGGGAGSETVGILYTPQFAYAPDAAVKIISVHYIPNSSTSGFSDSTTTDSLGRYYFNSLPEGAYNIFGSKDGALSYRASIQIHYADDGSINLDTMRDTLRTPGSLSGVIALMPGHDTRKVLVLFPGSQNWCSPDSMGNFTFTAVAQGTYKVRFLPIIPDYKILDTSFSFISHKNLILSDTIKLQYTGIPAVNNLTFKYDTLKQITTLQWHSTDKFTCGGFNIYRGNIDSTFSALPLNVRPIKDTFFHDSSAIQGMRYRYRVVTLDTSGNEGTTYTQTGPVTIVSAFTLVRTIGNGDLKEPVGLFVSNGKIYVANKGNSRIAVYDTSGTFLRTIGDTILKDIRKITLQGSYLYVPDMQTSVCIKVFDTSGVFIRNIPYKGYDISDIAVKDSAHIYIVDADAMQLFGIDQTGTITQSCNYTFSKEPINMGIRGDTVYVADSRTCQIIKFSFDLKTIGATSLPNINSTKFVAAIGSFTFTSDGGFYCDINAKTSLLAGFNPDGVIVTRFSPGFDKGSIILENDIFYSGNHLYIATSRNAIMVFKINKADR